MNRYGTTVREELAQAAGFFNGEGSTSVAERMHTNGVSYPGPRLGLTQVDPEMLYRFREAVGGLGKIGGPYKQKNSSYRDRESWSDSYRYWLCNFEHVQAVMAMMWPWLSDYKKTQYKRLAERMKEYYNRPDYKQRRKAA